MQGLAGVGPEESKNLVQSQPEGADVPSKDVIRQQPGDVDKVRLIPHVDCARTEDL